MKANNKVALFQWYIIGIAFLCLIPCKGEETLQTTTHVFDMRTDLSGDNSVWSEEKGKATQVVTTSEGMKILLQSNESFLPYLLHTKDKFTSLYGVYEIRVKFYDHDLAWPGFWLLDYDEKGTSVGNKWKDDVARIEIFSKEMRGDDTFIGLSWDSNAATHPICHKKHRHPKLSEGFHVFRLEWAPNRYDFSIDGKTIFSTSTGEITAKRKYLALFAKRKGTKKTLALAKPIMEVDYIKVKTSNNQLKTSTVSSPSKVEMKLQGNEMLPILPDNKKWQQVFVDTFDGKKLDTTKWSPLRRQWRKGGWWNPGNVSLNSKGQLQIKVSKDPLKPTQFASGGISTRGKFEHSYGYYTAKVKFQKQPGHWSAFWLQNVNLDPGKGGIDGAEIDIFEKAWLAPKIDHGIHFDGYKEFHGKSRQIVEIPGINEGYHTFSLWWTPTEYIFFCNGKETYRTSIGGINTKKNFMLLTSEIGGWAGDIKDAKLPDFFLVDEVKVYTIK